MVIDISFQVLHEQANISNSFHITDVTNVKGKIQLPDSDT